MKTTYAELTIVFLCVVLSAAPAQAGQVVNGIHSTWIARDGADLTKMDPARAAALMKTYPFPPGYKFPEPGTAPAQTRPVPTEPYFTWADRNGDSYITPIRDQGQCGSCFVFGSISVMESLFKITLGRPDYNPDLSEQKVISCTNLGSCATGGTAEGVGAHLKSLGTPDEECFPYTSGGTGTDGDCKLACADWQARASKIADWKMSVLPPDEATLKTQIKSGSTTSAMAGPVIANLQVYTDFYGYSAGVYSRSPGATASGWHIVTLMGWDDSDNSWIIKNSWDTTWGMDGIGKISRTVDCTNLFQTGLCFATHTTYFTVDKAEAPSAPCVDPRTTALYASLGDQSAAVDLTLKNCGTKGPITWDGATDEPSAVLAPSAGTLTAQQDVAVIVTFKPPSLGLGTHVFHASFLSGATAEARAEITVEVVNGPVPDGGVPDIGIVDAGYVDAGPKDVGTVVPDAGHDAGSSADTGGTADAGAASDSGVPADAGHEDAAVVPTDAAKEDAADRDAGLADNTVYNDAGQVTPSGKDSGASPADAGAAADESTGCSCATIVL